MLLLKDTLLFIMFVPLSQAAWTYPQNLANFEAFARARERGLPSSFSLTKSPNYRPPWLQGSNQPAKALCHYSILLWASISQTGVSRDIWKAPPILDIRI